MTLDLPSPTDLVRDLVTGYRRSQVTYLFARLGIADAVAAGAGTAESVAATCDTHPATTQRLLSALVELGLLTNEPQYALTDAGRLLCSDVPDTLAHWTIASCGSQYRAWQAADHAVRTGKASFDIVIGSSFWDSLAADPQAAARFDAGMADSVAEACALVGDELDLSDADLVADVGGGTGTLVAELLRAYPRLRAMVIDLPGVLERAASVLDDVRDRCELIGSDFLASVPSGADVYVLCRVLADWPDPDAAQLLMNCRAAMAPGRRLVVVGGLHRPGAPAARGMLDLHLLVVIGGRERTLDEITEMLVAADFRVSRVAEGGRNTLIEAIAV